MMNFVSIILLILVSFTVSQTTRNQILEKLIEKSETTKEVFKIYHFLFEKKYDLNSEEGIRRYKNFKQTLKFIKEHNSKKLSYTVGINQFSDLSREEYLATLMPQDMFLKQHRELLDYFVDFDSYNDIDEQKPISQIKEIPIGDWSVNLPPIKAQGGCGSCWAHGAAGAIEGAYSINKRVMPPVAFSVQQLVDCDTTNNGCKGGWPEKSYKYLQTVGLMFDKDYPYTGQQGQCRYDSSKPRVEIASYEYCSNYGVNDAVKSCTPDLFGELIHRGPVVVNIDASSAEFSGYTGGLFESNSNICRFMTHVVTLAGFGVDSNGVKYAIVRNSWGDYWGEKGVIRMKYDPADSTHTCFVTGAGFVPILK